VIRSENERREKIYNAIPGEGGGKRDAKMAHNDKAEPLKMRRSAGVNPAVLPPTIQNLEEEVREGTWQKGKRGRQNMKG